MFTGLSGFEMVVVFVSLILSVSLHEAMHAFTSHWLGDSTAHEEGRITLNPLKHIDLYLTIILPMVLIFVGLPPIFAAKPVPFNPMRVKYEEFGVALVGIAGPLTNLALACVGGLVFRLVPIASNDIANAVAIFTLVNVSLFVFNMIPIPPLDGSRLLYAFAPEPLQNFMMSIERFGLLIVMIILLAGSAFFAPIISSITSHILLFLLGMPG